MDQNYSELKLRHSKRGREDGKDQVGTRQQRVCLSMSCVTENISFPFNFDTLTCTTLRLMNKKQKTNYKHY